MNASNLNKWLTLVANVTDLLDELADIQARKIKDCPIMRNMFVSGIELVALISPEWYASAERALARLDEAE